MEKIRSLFTVLIASLSMGLPVAAQNNYKLTGKVVDPLTGIPVKGAVVSATQGAKSVETDSLGNYAMDVSTLSGSITVWANGFYKGQAQVLGRSSVNLMLVPESKLNYTETLVKPMQEGTLPQKASTMANVSKEGFAVGGLYVDQAIRNTIPGLMVLGKSGMPGEGSYMNSRGIGSLIGGNSPLVVIDGMPYLPDMSESPVIGGFSKSIFNALSASDVKNISFLRGAESSLYGSLGSNGVLMIETDDATDLDTKVSFVAQYGIASNPKNMPVMGVDDYKTYIGNVALTRYDDMADVLALFPYLKDDPDYYYKFLYNNNTNWQNQIYRPAFVTENLLKIKGGDAVAKYDLSFGYLNQQGQVENTDLTRYHMRLNANVTVSKKIDLFSSMSLAYLTNNLQEQGMVAETNPVIAAMAKAPLLYPYKKDQYNNVLPDYATVRNEDGTVDVANAVSNPLALVNTNEISAQGYDVMMSGGLNYKVSTDLKLTGMVGLYHNYNRSEVFVPGLTSGSIMPLSDGLANNTVRMGIAEAFNMYYNINASYRKKINADNSLSLMAGYQAMTTRREFDAGEGRNTSSDFYKTLDNVNTIGRSFYGYINEWNWMDLFAQAGYNYKNLLSAGVNLSVDGASSTGPDANALNLFPSVNVAWYLHNMSGIADVKAIDRLALRAEYVMTGNSNYSSNLSDYYYKNQVFRQLSGIVRGGIPNTDMKCENVATTNVGIDFSGFGHRLDLTLDLYNSVSSDVITTKSISSVNGTDVMYDNLAEISNKGVEAGLQLYLLSNRNGYALVGGTVAMNKNKVNSLGGEGDQIMEFADGSAVIVREGESAYGFYGYKTNGVYSTSAQATTDGLTDYAGNAFGAGDMRFVNVDASDKVIDKNDRVLLGNAAPNFFGRFYASAGYKKLSLTANFTYSVGNEAYNALRREFESMDGFGNQMKSVNRRWQSEGQVTDMPRAVYGDPMGNARFSDRWIEDASFVKLKELTLSYKLGGNIVKVLQGGTVYVSGENLLTFTDYLGADPEFSYSYEPYRQGFDYAKVALARTVKLGFKLNF